MQTAQNELVSIIVSVFNVETWLPMCLESIVQQTYTALEILLIDDGSSDQSGLICDSFAAKEPRARVIHQGNQGLWAVRNRGQKEAQGEFLVFVDGDDCLHKDFVQLLYEAIHKDGHPYPLAICGFTRNEEGFDRQKPIHNPSVSVLSRDELLDGFFSPSLATHIVFSANWNKLYRKESLDIPFQQDYLRCQDTESSLRGYLSRIDHAILVKEDLYFWRNRTGQLTETNDDIMIRNECRSRLYYYHFKNLPRSFKGYRHYLLLALYKRLSIWKNCIREERDQQGALAKISEYERRTFVAFLFCRHISLKRKLSILARMHCPRLVQIKSQPG